MTSANDAIPDLIDLRDLAPRLKRSIRALRIAARRGEFEHHFIGGQRYLTEDQAQKLLAASAVRAAQPVDGLAATRARVAAQRSRAAAKKATRGRAAASA